MGVPKFFRYISERYPSLSEVVREYQLPEFDNLYLDMNGIIHVCSHPNDADPHFRITEEKIFRDIFHYIETLFRMIQPQKLFFMAVDGVAPRAKMNQQRGRRFRSAKEAEASEASAKQRGEELPSMERFDSNCITPGTEFMTRLQAQLKYFVTFKVSTDKLWQKTKVILSGHETPGEGEHKIMDYIRYMKSQPGYDPNTRHCLYGLDADLIMLGLCTHEPNFSLLREEVKYGRKNNQKRIPTPEETTFFLLHLSLMRNYLDLEFQQLKTALSFPYNLENIIDDWVLMGFLVGNDFIPHLPDLHINKGALPILYKTYIDVLPTLGGYINEGGSLHLERFQKYMEKLAAFDFEQFKEYSADLKYFESKTGKPGVRDNNKNEDCLPLSPKNKDLAALITATEQMLEEIDDEDEDENYIDIDSDEEENEEEVAQAEFSAMKNNYYMEKLEYVKVTPEVLRSQSEGYVRAIQWNLHYYYNGCCSWSWFYPHHYAPYISDIKDFSKIKLEYELGQPFLPFQQLLAVLPAASKKLLPQAYHSLMEDDKSPIIQFYPTEFKTDLNGKRQEWEAVVLIPFIDQESLLQAMNTKEHELSAEEMSRNRHGPMKVYTYTPENLGSYVAPAFFPALANHHAKEDNVHREDLFMDRCMIVKGLCPGVRLDVYFPGFPTFQHIPFTATLKKAKVKVFESPSQGDNMILTIAPQNHPDVNKLAVQLLGKSVFVNWPHLFEARVVGVASKNKRFKWISEDDSIVSEVIDKALQEQLALSLKGIDERYMSRLGIEIGETEFIVYARTLEDKKFVMTNGKMQCEKQWSKYSVAYALQTVALNITVHEPTKDLILTMEQLFSPGAVVFLLESQYHGFKGVIDGHVENQCVRVCCEIESQPNLEKFKNKLWESSRQYVSGNIIGNRLKLSSHLLSRITGTIYVLPCDNQQESERKPFRLNIGLNLKFNKKNEEVCGYTRREKVGGYWLYSKKAEAEIHEYMKTFPEVFDYLKENTGVENAKAEDIYPENTAQKLTELGNWLKERESSKAERQTCGSQVVEEEVVLLVESFIDNFIKDEMIVTTETLSTNPSNLYVPKSKLGQSPDAEINYSLLDRIVNVRESYTVPLGAKGTVIGIHDVEKGPLAAYDILFDKEFTGGMKIRSSAHRGYRLPGQAIMCINIDKKRANGSKKTPNKQPSMESLSGSPLCQKVEFKSRKQPQNDHRFKDSPGRSTDAQSWLQSAPQQLSNEYLAIYQQLQRSGPKTKVQQNSKVAVNPDVEAANALKTALNICDDKSSDNRLQRTDLNSHCFCAQLIALHQRLGMKLPRYLYANTNNGAIICTVICGNGREFQGAPAYGSEPAAENAARVALQYVGAEDWRENSFVPPRPSLQTQPHQRTGFAPLNRLPQTQNFAWLREPAKPSTLPSPPTNWQSANRSHNFQPDWKSGTTSQCFFPSAPQYHSNKVSRQFNQYSNFNQASAVQTKPPYNSQQAASQVRPQTSKYTDSTKPSSTFSSRQENTLNRGPPSGSIFTGPRPSRPPRSRIAANFNVPFTSS